MPLPKLTVAHLKRAATSQSFSRGEDYFHAGAVTELTLRQQTLHAAVEGNEVEPYRVTVTFDSAGVTEARCSCPYSFEGWCKHIVATLLVGVHQPETIEERPSLSQLLERLSLSQTKELIQSLVKEDLSLLESVDFYVSRLSSVEATPKSGTSSKRKTSVDPAPYKRRAREILREAVRGWEDGQNEDSIADDLADVMQDALTFAVRGDGHSALALLKGITDGCAQYWDIVDDFIGMGPEDFDIDFDSAWTEALLSTDLTADEVMGWQAELEAWQDSLGGFDMALEALRQGWAYPPLQRIFKGEITEKGAWEAEAPDWADDFSQIRLAILKRQERYEDYLLLAQAEGQTQEYLTMLGQLGRVEEAMSVAQAQMATLQEAKSLAETLRAQNQLPQALDIAMRGLRLEPDSSYVTYDFASWTRDLAEGLGEPAAVLEASLVAFRAKPSLKDYQAIEALSGDDWPEMKEQLLQQLRRMERWLESEAQIDIFLYEGLIDDAINKVSGFSSYQDQLVLKVMDAAIASQIASHSEWVVKKAVSSAQAIMDEGKAKYYSTAVEWLKRAKAAYSALNRADEWSQYRRAIADTHGRKRKLMELLKQNRLQEKAKESTIKLPK